MYGVCFDDNMNAVYRYAESFEECKKFCGSKYVHVDLQNTYSEVAKCLQQDIEVLFVGLPCHIAGLKNYVSDKDNENLYTIDLICNGTPYKKVWGDYVNFIENYYGAKLSDFKFRQKGDRRNPYKTKAVFCDGKEIVDSHITASYNRLYLKKLIIKKACFHCKYKNDKRVGDLTIGDFWGIEKYDAEIDDGNGVSMVIVNSGKGEELINNIKKIVDLQIVDLNNGYSQNNLKKQSDLPFGYNKFQNEYINKKIEFVLRKYADCGFIGALRHCIRHVYRYFIYR